MTPRFLDLVTDEVPLDVNTVGREHAILVEQEDRDRRVYLESLGLLPTVTPPANNGVRLARGTVVLFDGLPCAFGDLSSYERKLLTQGADGIWRGSYPF